MLRGGESHFSMAQPAGKPAKVAWLGGTGPPRPAANGKLEFFSRRPMLLERFYLGRCAGERQKARRGLKPQESTE